MSTLPPPQPHPFEPPPVSPSSRGGHHPAMAGPEPEQPKVSITGDLMLCVTQSEAALHPITGHFSFETAGMREALYPLWQAEGQVQRCHGRSTSIAFDMRGVRAGETRTYLVAVQVAESGVQGQVVLSGVFVQVVVLGDESGAP